MSNFHNSPSFVDDGNLKDASTSVQELPSKYRITSAASSSVTVLNIFGRNNQHNNTPEREDSDSSNATSSTKPLKVMKFKNKYHQLHLDLSDFGDSDITEIFLSTSSECKNTTEPISHKCEEETNKPLMNRISKKPRCKTNTFKALKSFEKNNLCTSNKITQNQDLQSVFGVVKKLRDQKYIRPASTDTKLQNLISDKEKSETTIDTFFKSKFRETKWINTTAFSEIEKFDLNMPEKVPTPMEKVPTLMEKIPSIYSSVPSSNLSSCESKQNTFSSSSLGLLFGNLNAQDKFKLKVRKATTKIEYICRNCRFLHLSEPEMKKPLLILDFDSLLIPFGLPCEDLSKHKLEISRLIHTMHSHFNIAIWSATNMKILVSRLQYLKVFDEEKLTKITFCLDCTSTITAFIPVVGNTIVKPPEIIWNLYPQFNKKNTIMINEDLKKFVFNHYGVPVGAQKDQSLIKYFELVIMTDFLINLITSNRSFSNMNIQSWKKPWK